MLGLLIILTAYITHLYNTSLCFHSTVGYLVSTGENDNIL